MPVVLVGPRLPGSGCPGVLLDNFHAGYTMTRHLIERGQSKIGFFANHAISHYVNDRYQGYRWAMKEAGLPEPVNSVFLEESRHIDFEDPLAEPTAFAERYLDRVNLADVQAVVCVDDYFANGLIRAALSRGLRVPEDLKVTGIGGLSFQPPGGITLTTYQVPYERIGTETFHLIETTLASQAAGSERPKDIVIEGQVLARSSTSSTS